MVTNQSISLWKWQRDVAEILPSLYGSGATCVIKSRRQCGKSVLLSTLLYLASDIDPKTESPRTSILVTLDQRSCREIQHKIYSIDSQRPSKYRAIKSKEPSNQISDIVFNNGSRILFFSAEARPKNLRGYTASGILIIDEAAFISAEIYNVVLPFTNIHHAPIFLSSTPAMKTGFFYQDYITAISGEPNYYLFDWADSKYNDKSYTQGTILDEVLTPAQLESARKRMTSINFRQDYLAEFTELRSSAFGEFKHLVSAPSSNKRLFIGIDPGNGQGKDYTALVALNDKCEEVLVEHFNEGGAQDQIDFCIRVIDSLIAEGYTIASVLCEYNNPRVTYEKLHEYYNRKNISVRSITVNGSENHKNSKVALINDLQLAFSDNSLTLLDCNWHLNELADYEMHVTGKHDNHNTFDGAHLHDDSVMALAHAYRAYKDAHYRGFYA